MKVTMSGVQKPNEKKAPINWSFLGSVVLGTLLGGIVDSLVFEFGFDAYYLYTCAPINIPIGILGALAGRKTSKSSQGKLIGMWIGGIGLPMLFAIIAPLIVGMLGMT